MPSSITWTTDFGITLSMGFDAVLAETHELEGEATMHSVEKGSDITDHVHINPEVIS